MEFIKKTAKSNDMLRVLGIRSFFFMMISELISQFAFSVQHFALIFVVYESTRSSTAVSGIILSFTIPALLFSIVSGVYVDRWNKKKVLFFTNLIRGFLILPFLIPDLHISFIYLLTFLIAVATQFFIPAHASVIPSLVPRKLLLSANAVFSFGIYGTTLLGYIFSGPIVLLVGKQNTFLLLAVFFYLSSIFVLFINLPEKKKRILGQLLSFPAKASLTNEAREIFSFIRRARKVFHALLMMTIAQSVIYMFAVLAPGYMTRILNAQIESLSLVLIGPAALGMGISAFMLGSFGKHFNPRWLSGIGFLLGGAVFILFPFGNKVISLSIIKSINSILPYFLTISMYQIAIVMAFIVGFAISFVFIPSNTTLQTETNESMRGRVYGLLNAVIGAVSFLPIIMAGGLADLLGIPRVVVGFGIIMIILGIFFWVFE
ncbi:MAG: MFS transporter [Candidatus Levybacteria bacterium]|nr:MFS transporter [Candidatus Levybacteria bacterium]